MGARTGRALQNGFTPSNGRPFDMPIGSPRLASPRPEGSSPRRPLAIGSQKATPLARAQHLADGKAKGLSLGARTGRALQNGLHTERLQAI